MRLPLMNAAVLVVLIAIALGLVLMPRFNYSTLLGRQGQVERKLWGLHKRVEALEALPGGTAAETERRRVILKTLDALPSAIEEIRSQLSVNHEQIATLGGILDELETRLSTLEAGVPLDAEPRSRRPDASYSDRYTDPIDLPKDLAERAKEFSARGTAEWSYESFLENGVARGLLPFDSPTGVPAPVGGRLMGLFELYKSHVNLVNLEERMHVADLVEDADASGDYEEFPSTFDAGNVHARIKGIVHFEHDDQLGSKRVYQFPLHAHPEFARFGELRDNALKHFVRDVHSLVTRSKH